MRIDADILPVFLEEAAGYLRTLREEHAEPERLLRAAHGLKGAASILDLRALMACAVGLERTLREGGGVPAAALGEAEGLLEELRVAARHEGEVSSPALDAAEPPSASRPEEVLEDHPLEEEWDRDTARMLRALFAEEAHDHLEAISEALVRFDRTPSGRDVEAILRKAHTLKGSASTVGLSSVSEAAHRLEEELVAVQAGRPSGPQLVDRLLAALDVLRSMVEDVDTGESAASQLERFTLALVGQQPTAPAPSLPRPAAAAEPRDDAADSDEPLLVRDQDGGRESERDRERRAAERRSHLDRRLDAQRVRVEVARLDRLMDVVGELVIDRTRVERRVEELKGLARDLGLSRQALRAALADLRGQNAEPQVTRLGEIEMEVADAVANLGRATADLLEDSEALRRTSHSLQEILGQVRMIPIRWLHAKLQRPLRGMARSQDKLVELIVDDESSEMDRSIAEQVTDSLLQLIRNAVAHGIETPAERAAAGKPAVGRICIVAHHRGDFVCLEVEDDGAGIDPRKLRETLVRLGRLGNGRLLSDQDALDHIFDSGFSTRAKADGLAGRGVGLDLVRENIRALGGTISVSSQLGRGTRFTMRIPLTTAIAQALLIKIGEPVYALPVAHVVETLVVQPGGLRARAAGGEPAGLSSGPGDNLEVMARGGWLPLLHLHRLLGADAPIPLQRPLDLSPGPGRQPVVVLEFGGALFGVTCTRVIGPREIVLKRLGRVLAGFPVFAGATISGSSKVQFVLDVAFLARQALGTSAAPALRWQEVEAGGPRVLVADDSRSVREAVAQILRGAGYSVDVAADGWEAWERLQLRSYDLLVTDLEMPRLHGYELIARCRRAPGLARLPIVVLTSRTADRNREAALKSGASDFIAKPINRRVMLEHLRALLV